MSEEATLDDFVTDGESKETDEKRPIEAIPGSSVESSLDETSVGEIPNDWKATRLEDIATETEYGLTETAEPYDPKKPRYIRTQDFDDYGGLKDDSRASLSREKAKDGLLEKGDILFARSGSVGASLGKTFLYETDYGECCFGGYSIRHRLKEEGLNHKYISQYTLGKQYWDWVRRRAKTTAQSNINTGEYGSLLIPVPPLSEQRKIATVLYTVDQAIQITENIIEEYKIIKSEVSQNLVFHGINNEDYKTVRLGPKQIEVPSDWRVSSFGEISDVQQGLQIAKSKRFKEDGEDRYQYITVQHLNDPQDPANNWYIENPRDTVVCNKKDVLMTRTGNTGEVVTGVEGAFHNNFFKIQFDRDVLLRDYLVHYLESKAIQDVLISYAGTTTIPDLNHGEFFNIPVLLPPIDEQKLIAEKAEELSDIVSLEEEYLNRLQCLKQGLISPLHSFEISSETSQTSH